MIKKGMLYGMGGWSQLFFLLFLSFAGYVLALLLILSLVDIQSIEHSSSVMRLTMAIQSICLFLIPSSAFIFFCQGNSREYLTSGRKQNLLFCILAILLIVIIQPLISAIGHYNQQLILPESFAAIENWMKASEENAEKAINILLSNKSITSLLLNIFVLAIIAGITEEVFFRGCMQQIFEKITSNKHSAIWITAFIFSAIHFQFYGFVPRLLLGALLGYLFVWSGNIILPIIVHSCNNAISVFFAFLYIGTPTYDELNNITPDNNALLILSSLAITAFLIYFLYRNRIRRIEI